MSTIFPVVLVPEAHGRFRAVVRDIPEVLTWGDDVAETLDLAGDAIEVAIGHLLEKGLPIPTPSAPQPGDHMVPVPAPFAAKLAVIRLFQESGLSKAELGRRLGVADVEVQRILDPDHRTKIERLDQAARALGGRLVVSVSKAA